MKRPEQRKYPMMRKCIVGGMITDKTIKYTKNNKTMAFINVRGSAWNRGSYCLSKRL